jgi:hypothetical protein
MPSSNSKNTYCKFTGEHKLASGIKPSAPVHDANIRCPYILFSSARSSCTQSRLERRIRWLELRIHYPSSNTVFVVLFSSIQHEYTFYYNPSSSMKYHSHLMSWHASHQPLKLVAGRASASNKDAHLISFIIQSIKKHKFNFVVTITLLSTLRIWKFRLRSACSTIMLCMDFRFPFQLSIAYDLQRNQQQVLVLYGQGLPTRNQDRDVSSDDTAPFLQYHKPGSKHVHPYIAIQSHLTQSS